MHLTLRGRAFALKRYVPDFSLGRQVLQLWPLHPDRVTVTRRPNGVIDYRVATENGKPVSYGRHDILHFRGMSLDGLDGVSMVQYAAASIQGMLAAESHARRYFDTGASVALAAIHPDNLGPDGLDNLRKSIQTYIGGLKNAYGVFVADEGIDLKPIGIDPEKSQLLATRELTAVQVANWCNLPPGMLGDSKTPTFASSRQFRQDLVDITFRPLTERLEARIDLDLLSATDDNPMRYFSKFNMDSLLRGDPNERSQIQERDIRAGSKTRNEARLENDDPPLPGLDEPIVAANMATGGADGRSNARVTGDQIRTLHVAQQLVREEQTVARKLAERHASDGGAWQDGLRTFYGKHAHKVAESLQLPLDVAREHCGRQGMRLQERGLDACLDWEWTVGPELANLALDREAVTNAITHS